MKKIIVFATALVIGSAAFSQDSSSMRPMGGSDTMMHHKMGMGMHKMKDCVMMKDGMPMVMKDGKTMPMDQQMTLPNGTVIMTDGTVKSKDGTTKMLKNGDYVNMDGTMGKMMMHDKMKMKKDSTMM